MYTQLTNSVTSLNHVRKFQNETRNVIEIQSTQHKYSSYS